MEGVVGQRSLEGLSEEGAFMLDLKGRGREERRFQAKATVCARTRGMPEKACGGPGKLKHLAFPPPSPPTTLLPQLE